jgi:hypothetical protein
MTSETFRRIQRRAYELWEAEGRPEGKEEAHWLTAERELEQEAREGKDGIPVADETPPDLPPADAAPAPAKRRSRAGARRKS